MCHSKNLTYLLVAYLFYLPVKSVGTTTRAIFLQFQSVGVIPSILGSSICPLLALSTGKMNDNPRFRFPSHNLLYDAAEGTSTYCFPPFPNSKTQALF